MKLYHGTNLKIDSLQPREAANPRDLSRLGGKTRAIYASEHLEEALVHGIGKALGLKAHPGYGNDDDKWSISLPDDIDALDKNPKVYIYEVPSDKFIKNDLDEWVTSEEINPVTSHELTLDESLSHFDEIRLLGKPGGPEKGNTEGWI